MSLKNGAKMSQREKFDLINSEVRSFYEYCKEAGMSDEEMDLICRPLTNAVRKSTIKRWTRVVLVLIMGMAIGYTVSQTDTFKWHASAVARIVLIKLLPVWDWTPLYHNKCMIARPEPPNVDGGVSTTDCIACEAVSKCLHQIFVAILFIDFKVMLGLYLVCIHVVTPYTYSYTDMQKKVLKEALYIVLYNTIHIFSFRYKRMCVP